MSKQRNSKGTRPKAPSNAGKSNQRSKQSVVGREYADTSTERNIRHKYNDVSWYAKNPAILRDAASYSYNAPLGNRVPFIDVFTGSNTDIAFGDECYVPGLMALGFIPGIGISESSTSPANLAAQDIYSFVRYKNSGAKNYDQADLMLYFLSMDSIYMMWNWLKRMYGYLRLYSQYNKYLPRALAKMDGLTFDDAIANLADFRLALNQTAARISSFCVPAVMPIFIRHSWLCSNLYLDSNNHKAQMYAFRPDAYLIYDETGSKFGGQLLAEDLRTAIANGASYSYYIGILNQMLDRIAYSEDIGVMSGDILKAYGDGNLFKISAVEPDYMVQPVYNEEVLNQIHNSTAHGLIQTGSLTECNITQNPDTGFLIYKPRVAVPGISMTGAFINMPWDDVTPENTMVGTRLTSLIGEDNGDNTAYLQCIGSEFIDSRWIIYYNASNNLVMEQVPDHLIFDQQTNGASQVKTLVRAVARYSNFDWHPLVSLWQDTKNGERVTRNFRGMLGDVNNYTVIKKTQLENMHLTALLGEFNVPQLGSF